MQRDEFLRLLGARSATLYDRLTATRPRPVRTDEATAIAERRLTRWRDHLNRFDPDGFSRRLKLAGVKMPTEELRDRLAPWHPDEALAEALPWMAEAWDLAVRLATPTATGLHRADDPIPFEDLFSGLAAEEAEALWADIPEAAALFSEPAKAALARNLIASLSNALASCLEHEFSRFRLHEAAERNAGARSHYDGFLDILRAGQAAPLLVKYAEATRRAAVALGQWRRTSRAFLHRFAEDRPAIGAAFGWPVDEIVVKALDVGLSDRHNGGAQVHRLRLSGGHTLYYKPRPLGLEAAIGTLIEETAPAGPAVPPPLLDRGAYGWALGVTAAAPELATYYRGAGRTLALAWLFGATDLHDENVIATATGPVLVDAETVAAPVPRSFASSPATALALAEYDTVLRPGLLSRWTAYADGHLVQAGGLAHGRNQQTGVSADTFVHINTDAMAIEPRAVGLDGAPVLPEHDPGAYVDDLVTGFRAACDGLLRDAGPRPERALAGLSTRVIVRDTNAYTALLNRLRLPQFALTTLDADIEIESLAATFVATETAEALWPLYEHERAAIRDGDVPTFSVEVGATHWRDDDGRAVDLFSRSGLDLIGDTLAALNADTVAIQVALIRTAFHEATGLARPQMVTAPEGFSSEAALAEARRIGGLLLTMAHRGHADDGDETLTWFAPRLSPGGDRARIEDVPADLYDGQAGIGLFLAALARTTGDSSYAGAARTAFRPLVEDALARAERKAGALWAEPEAGSKEGDVFSAHSGESRNPGQHDQHRRNPPWTPAFAGVSGVKKCRSDAPLETSPPATRTGGCVGPTSAAYALRQAGRLLGDRDLEDAAHAWATTAFAQPIPTDADWIDGLAGAAVALAPFHDLAPDGWVRAVCETLSVSEPPQPGAGHGLAGPLHALHRLGAAVDVPAARLDRHWRAETKNWDPEAATGWAHGPEGIVLMLHACRLAPDRIAAALDALAQAPACDLDTLAAGTAARIEMWRSVGEPDRARSAAAAMCTRAAHEGRFRVPGGGVPLPGLFDGLAGIGYTLLRLDHAEALPSVLLLEDGHAAL